MKSQLLTFIMVLVTFSANAFAEKCELTLTQRVDSAAARRPLEKFGRTLEKMHQNANLFSYFTHETEISTTYVDAESAHACYELAVAKAAENEDSVSHIEILPLRDLNVEERFLDVPTHPIVRWGFADAWALPSRGSVSKYTETCHGTSEDSFRGTRLYQENCSRM